MLEKNKSIQNIAILGVTGSIGTQTLEVISENTDKYNVFAVSANDNAKLLFEICKKYQPKYAVIANEKLYKDLSQKFKENNLETKLLAGKDNICEIAKNKEVNQVVAAIVGSAGLPSIYSAVKAGKRILLANKESLVMTGKMLLQQAEKYNALIIPVDSEHNALFQCMPKSQGFRTKSLAEAGISKLVLTGSGGPFLNEDISLLAGKTPDQACNHPNWSMGRKISVDSATMMNKGLEYIEASLLFNASPSELDVVIHPQSIIHSFVQYKDGSSIAQLGISDMRVPIACCLAYPKRIKSGVADIDLSKQTLSFDEVNYDRFPCLKLAIEVAKNSYENNNNYLPLVMNAANEVAVEKFLNGQIKFTDIYKLVNNSVNEFDKNTSKVCASIETSLEIDKEVRIYTLGLK